MNQTYLNRQTGKEILKKLYKSKKIVWLIEGYRKFPEETDKTLFFRYIASSKLNEISPMFIVLYFWVYVMSCTIYLYTPNWQIFCINWIITLNYLYLVYYWNSEKKEPTLHSWLKWYDAKWNYILIYFSIYLLEHKILKYIRLVIMIIISSPINDKSFYK